MQPHAAKNHLKNNHWTQQEAAQALGVTVAYLNRVLNDQMKSKRLIKAVLQLKPQTPKKRPVYVIS